MSIISKRAQAISPSPTLTITAKAKKMMAEGINVISFGAGEPDFDTPDNIKMAAKHAIDIGFTKYTPTSGILDLKTAICDKLKRDNELDYEPKNILVSNGAKQCLYNALQVITDPGDEIIIPLPYWVSYEEMVKLAGGKCVFAKTDDFLLDPAELEKLITPRTKALLLASPSNPTGAVYHKARLEAIAKICVKNNILVISDEIYEKLIYDGQHVSIASLNDEIKKLTVVVNGVSKSYSMTGWRIGYCAAEEEIINAASNLQDHSTSNPNSIAQMAAVEALQGGEEAVKMMRIEFERRRDIMVDLINDIEGFNVDPPAGAFYLLVDVSSVKGYKGSDDFCKNLLEAALVACIPGSAFGADDYIRLSFATSEANIREGLKRIGKFITEKKEKG